MNWFIIKNETEGVTASCSTLLLRHAKNDVTKKKIPHESSLMMVITRRITEIEIASWTATEDPGI